MIADPSLPLGDAGTFGQAIDFIFSGQSSTLSGGHVGGLHQILTLTGTHLKVTGLAMALAMAVALPAGVLLGHFGRGEFLAIAIGNAGRALPELAVIVFMASAIGVGVLNVTIALAILAVPPILTNTFVAIRQVDRDTVQAATGVGMGTAAVISRVEVPLAVPTIMSGIRTSTINVVATATIAPLAGVLTLGDLIISRNVYGDDGVLAGAICVAVLALLLELGLSVVQHFLTSPGLRLQRASA